MRCEITDPITKEEVTLEVSINDNGIRITNNVSDLAFGVDVSGGYLKLTYDDGSGTYDAHRTKLTP